MGYAGVDFIPQSGAMNRLLAVKAPNRGGWLLEKIYLRLEILSGETWEN
jgi:hypothetical protein